MIGLGSNSSSKIGDYSYWQNFYSVSEYEKCISKKQFPIYRGHRMTDDDAIRRDVIQRLRSYFKVETGEIESRYHLTFDRYFKPEIEALQPLIQDGLVYRNNGTLGIIEDGTLLLAMICNQFDYYKYDRSK
jgi:oxygen-independent coproporphyrinogen-3 oxidase